MRVVIADDHSIVRSGLRYVVTEIDPQAEIQETESYAALTRVLEEGAKPDLVIADLWMPGYVGPGDMAGICRRAAPAPVAVISMTTNPDEMRTVLSAGAKAFIPKSTEGEQMVGILRLVISGGGYIPPELGLGTVSSSSAGGIEQLSRRQRDVLELLAQGLTNKDIGERLGLELPTVKSHLAAIFRTLGVESRTQAVLAYKSWGRPSGF
ncbi:response regulator transcription factor [Arenibaculum pallidiluteum]|uniref:response regulator transcription factor n=1 Tax=Arenibaculum pallidiluteum TaxID=2812559 RepID=UPI001A956CDF|nr:response regulator transcription factor [Arenibaculum pallidiluteum]